MSSRVATNLPARRSVARQREIAVAIRQVEDALIAATGLSDLTEVADPPHEPGAGSPAQPDVDDRVGTTESGGANEGSSAS